MVCAVFWNLSTTWAIGKQEGERWAWLQMLAFERRGWGNGPKYQGAVEHTGWTTMPRASLSQFKFTTYIICHITNTLKPMLKTAFIISHFLGVRTQVQLSLVPGFRVPYKAAVKVLAGAAVIWSHYWVWMISLEDGSLTWLMIGDLVHYWLLTKRPHPTSLL